MGLNLSLSAKIKFNLKAHECSSQKEVVSCLRKEELSMKIVILKFKNG